MQNCPNCSTSLDPTVGIDGKPRTPVQTDFTVCTNCIKLLKFDSALKFTIANPTEIDTIAVQDPAGYRKITQAQSRIAIGNGHPYPPSL